MFLMNYDDRKARFFARTMHTPDDETRAALRTALREVSRALIPLHRTLIHAAREDYAFAFGPVKPTQMVHLLNDAPFFAWLKPVTALIVDIDEMARRDFEPSDVESIAGRLEALFGNSANGDFSKHYVPILQRSVDVAANHAAVRKALARLR